MAKQQQKRKGGLIRGGVRWFFRIAFVLILIAAGATVYVLWDGLHHRFVEFPREAKAWQAIRAERVEPTLDDGWTEFRGACHSHSYLSHDSEVPFEDIQAACKEAGLQFICMSDHCPDDGKADYSKGWKGMHDGVLFVRGYEMANGFMPWGLPDTTILDKGADPKALAAQIQSAGGLLFFAHSEEDRPWDLPELNGMEIYNIHTDMKDEGEDGLKKLLPDILVSIRTYPDQVLRQIYDPQPKILAKWDELNRTRNITGIAANDCHQNTGVRGIYTDKDTLLVCMTSSKEDKLGEYKLNGLTRPLLRLFAGPLKPDTQVFRFDLDPYARQLRYVNTHVLARELSEPGLMDALKAGRVFVAFDMIADARGFVFLAEDGTGRKAVMGETVGLTPATRLRAESPYPVRFRLMRDGTQVVEQTGRAFDQSVKEPGKYRLEAELDVNGTWTPWLYTNPIRVAPAGEAAPGAAGGGAL